MKILILHIFLFSCLAFKSLNAETIVVGKNHLKSIKVALEKANNQDTILIKEGWYKEGNIVVKKSLTIIGESYPILDGENKDEILTVAAQNVIIKGLRFINSGKSNIDDLAAVKGLNAHQIKVVNNKFENTFFGVHLSNSNYSLIENNTFHSSGEYEKHLGNGVHLWQCHDAQVINNEIVGHRDAIYLEFVTNSSVRGNNSYNNIRYGLHFMFSHDNEYLENVFKNNGAGVAVMYTRNVKMIRNTFENNWGPTSFGMLLKDISRSEIKLNRFIGNTTGIYMEGTSNSLFELNEFSKNGYAIKLLASCDNNKFRKNNFKANTFDISTNGSLVLNNLENNYWDKYQGYDLDKDGTGDIAYHPVSMFSMIVEKVPSAVMLWRSFLVFLLDKAERVVPAITPEKLKDESPNMKPYDLHK